MYIHFDSWQEKYKKPFGAIKVDRPVKFMLEAYDVDVTSVELYVYADGKLIPEIIGMEIRVQGVIIRLTSQEKVDYTSIISNW